MKEYKTALRRSEETREQLQLDKGRLEQASLMITPSRGMTTPTHGMTTPIRPASPPDTPSKDVVLDQEPHGAEFEVCV